MPFISMQRNTVGSISMHNMPSEYSIAYSNDGTFSTKFQDQGKILNRDDRYSKFYMYSCHHLCWFFSQLENKKYTE